MMVDFKFDALSRVSKKVNRKFVLVGDIYGTCQPYIESTTLLSDSLH